MDSAGQALGYVTLTARAILYSHRYSGIGFLLDA